MTWVVQSADLSNSTHLINLLKTNLRLGLGSERRRFEFGHALEGV